MPDEAVSVTSVTKEEFSRYESVRKSGHTNMFLAHDVAAFAELTVEQCLWIMGNYGELSEKYLA